MSTLTQVQYVQASEVMVSAVTQSGEYFVVDALTTVQPYAAYFSEIMAGQHGAIAPANTYPPQFSPEELLININGKRDAFMAKYVTPYGDIMAWDELTPGQRNQVAIYRAQLMAIESQPGYPSNIVWPAPPQFN